MALPTSSDVSGLEYIYFGQPSVECETKTGQNSGGLEFIYFGLPIVGAAFTGPAPVAYDTTQFFMVFC